MQDLQLQDITTESRMKDWGMHSSIQHATSSSTPPTNQMPDQICHPQLMWATWECISIIEHTCFFIMKKHTPPPSPHGMQVQICPIIAPSMPVCLVISSTTCHIAVEHPWVKVQGRHKLLSFITITCRGTHCRDCVSSKSAMACDHLIISHVRYPPLGLIWFEDWRLGRNTFRSPSMTRNRWPQAHLHALDTPDD
jgi:hypothetical protein